MIPEPTDADRARDPEADLAMCNAATPEPWEGFPQLIGADNYHASTEVRGNPVYQFGKRFGSTPICKLASGFIWFEGDCKFIPLARTALPAYIRLYAAEKARAERLEALLRSTLAWVPVGGPTRDEIITVLKEADHA